ncbi:MAG TPA: hypothetical protein VFO44_00705 [Steroidobacteraceae bacterium]|nr:hypothetical protein [Steroidobacteraceae bacterium]
MAAPIEPSPSSASAGSLAGIVLMSASLLEIPAMLHHPEVRMQNPSQAIAQLTALNTLAAWVHGTLIALMLLILTGLTEFARRRDLRRPLIRTGLVVYAAGVVGMIGAALVSGYITGRVPGTTLSVGAEDLAITTRLLALCMLFNQAFARFGALAMSAGIALWSLDLARLPGLARALGSLGVVIGVFCVATLILGVLQLDVRGMLLVIVLQAIWCVGLGLFLWRSAQADYQPIP